jgi:hypothetical protein
MEERTDMTKVVEMYLNEEKNIYEVFIKLN